MREPYSNHFVCLSVRLSIRPSTIRCNAITQTMFDLAGIGITFFSMCQMAPSILFQWDITNFNGPFDNLNAPKGRK